MAGSKVTSADIAPLLDARTEFLHTPQICNFARELEPGGGSIGTSMVTWMDTPHFYKAGHIIVFYVGSDTTILGLLEQMPGPQFAGR